MKATSDPTYGNELEGSAIYGNELATASSGDRVADTATVEKFSVGHTAQGAGELCHRPAELGTNSKREARE